MTDGNGNVFPGNMFLFPSISRAKKMKPWKRKRVSGKHVSVSMEEGGREGEKEKREEEKKRGGTSVCVSFGLRLEVSYVTHEIPISSVHPLMSPSIP